MVAKQLADDEPQKTLKDSPKFESKSHKKKHKRKLEDPEPEEVTVIESKKEKKKKKKQKQNQEQEGSIVNSENLSGSNGKVETFNGPAEFSEKSSTNVVVTGKDANESKYKALAKFVDSGLPSDVLECCKNFEKPSPIQSHSWPFLLDGRDFIGIAKTGSGMQLWLFSVIVEYGSWGFSFILSCFCVIR